MTRLEIPDTTHKSASVDITAGTIFPMFIGNNTYETVLEDST